MRYSKGVDEVNSEYAVMRACQLVEMLGAGEVIGGTIDICSSDLNDRVIRVKAQRVNELLGTRYPRRNDGKMLGEGVYQDCRRRRHARMHNTTL